MISDNYSRTSVKAPPSSYWPVKGVPVKLRFSTPNRILSPVLTDATLFDTTCCVVLHTLLLVVGSCCVKVESSQTFSYVQMDVTPNNVASLCTGFYFFC